MRKKTRIFIFLLLFILVVGDFNGTNIFDEASASSKWEVVYDHVAVKYLTVNGMIEYYDIIISPSTHPYVYHMRYRYDPINGTDTYKWENPLGPYSVNKYDHKVTNTSSNGSELHIRRNNNLYAILSYGQSAILPAGGSYTIGVQKGNNGNSALKLERRLANSSPSLNLDSQSANQIISNNGTITISGTVQDPDNDTVTVSASIGGVSRSTTVNNTSTARNWSLTWEGSALPQGSWNNIVVTANDGKDGTDSKTYTGTLIVDKTAPSISVNGIVDGQTYTSSITPTFNATDSVSGVESVTATLDRNGNTTNFVSGTEITQGGDYVLTITARDKAGNSSQRVISFSIKPPQPILEIVKVTEKTIEIKDNQTYSGGQVERRYSLVDELGVTVSTSPWTEENNYQFTDLNHNHKYKVKIDVRYKE